MARRFLRFDGSDDRVTATLTASITAGITVGVWVRGKRIAANGARHLFNMNTDDWALIVNADNTLTFRLKIAGTARDLTTTKALAVSLSDGMWHEIVCWYDGTDMKLIVDGAVVAADGTYTGAITDSGNSFTLGGLSGGGYFVGDIACFCVYDQALPGKRMGYNRLHPNSPATRDMVLSYTQESVDTVAEEWLDRSKNAFDGTINGALWFDMAPLPATYGMLSCDGVDDRYQFNADSTNNLQVFTAMARWYAHGDTNMLQAIAAKHQGVLGQNWWLMRPEDCRFLISSGSGGGKIILEFLSPPEKRKWHFTVMQKEESGGNSITRLYHDGVLQDSDTRTSYNLGGSSQVVTVGARGDPGDWMKVDVTEFYLYNRVLRPDEMEYNRYRPGRPILDGLAIGLTPETFGIGNWDSLVNNGVAHAIYGSKIKAIRHLPRPPVVA